ncbi:MAG: hypothetical protein AAB582_02985 [Patescibacteria group bacterium]
MKPTHYKYLSIVLGIIAIVFAALYFMRPEPTVRDINENLGDRVESCSEELGKWDTKYGDKPASAEKETALQDALNECSDELKKGQDTLTP